jgi:hypothetical protein
MVSHRGRGQIRPRDANVPLVNALAGLFGVLKLVREDFDARGLFRRCICGRVGGLPTEQLRMDNRVDAVRDEQSGIGLCTAIPAFDEVFIRGWHAVAGANRPLDRIAEALRSFTLGSPARSCRRSDTWHS